MEMKIKLLEQRLILVERFLETRFCEPFSDFTYRNLGAARDHEVIDDESYSVALKRKGKRTEDQEDRNTPAPTNTETSKMVSTRGRRSARLSTRKKPYEAGTNTNTAVISQSKELRIRICRIEGNFASDQELACPSNVSTTRSDVGAEMGDEDGETESEPVIVKVANEDIGDDQGDDGEDDYFTFPYGDENEDSDHGGVADSAEIGGEAVDSDTSYHQEPTEMDSDDGNWSESVDNPNKRRRPRPNSAQSTATGAKKAKRKLRNPSNGQNVATNTLVTKECPVCHIQCTASLLDTHVATHTVTRHLKCSFCEKRFFNRRQKLKHEKIHQPDKYAKICRVPNCGKTAFENDKLLLHERICIRKSLEAGVSLDSKLLEEVKRKSLNVYLGWPDTPGTPKNENEKFCRFCKKIIPKKEYLAHVRNHATWKCSICDEMFVLQSSLKKHLKVIHKGEGENSKDGMLGDDGNDEGESEENDAGENEELLKEPQPVTTEVLGQKDEYVQSLEK